MHTLLYKLTALFQQPGPSRAAHLETGEWGERLAVSYLKRNGYSILSTRFRIRKDEIDIIARTKHFLIFVEVKTRKNIDFGRPAAAVDRKKRRNMSRAAAAYVKKLGQRKPPCLRFDIIEVIGEPGDEDPEIKHIENAFQADERYHMQW